MLLEYIQLNKKCIEWQNVADEDYFEDLYEWYGIDLKLEEDKPPTCCIDIPVQTYDTTTNTNQIKKTVKFVLPALATVEMIYLGLKSSENDLNTESIATQYEK